MTCIPLLFSVFLWSPKIFPIVWLTMPDDQFSGFLVWLSVVEFSQSKNPPFFSYCSLHFQTTPPFFPIAPYWYFDILCDTTSHIFHFRPYCYSKTPFLWQTGYFCLEFFVSPKLQNKPTNNEIQNRKQKQKLFKFSLFSPTKKAMKTTNKNSNKKYPSH